MSGLLSLGVADKLSPALVRYAEDLEGDGRVDASRSMGTEVLLLVVEHLQKMAATKHDTANRLGAAPTNYIAQAADMVAATGVVASDEGGVSLQIRHPIVARAFRDIVIAPKKSAALTIPVAAIAYGRRAGEFPNLFIYHSKTTGNTFLAERQKEKSDRPNLLFLLVRQVTQKQDRSLMPSDDEITEAAARGFKKYAKQIAVKNGFKSS